MYSVGRMALSNAEEPLGPQNVGSSRIMSSPLAASKSCCHVSTERLLWLKSPTMKNGSGSS